MRTVFWKYKFFSEKFLIWVPLAVNIENLKIFQKSSRWRHIDVLWPKSSKIVRKDHYQLELNQKGQNQNAYGILKPSNDACQQYVHWNQQVQRKSIENFLKAFDNISMFVNKCNDPPIFVFQIVWNHKWRNNPKVAWCRSRKNWLRCNTRISRWFWIMIFAFSNSEHDSIIKNCWFDRFWIAKKIDDIWLRLVVVK